MLDHMFQLPQTVTLLEKVLRPALMYLILILFLRLFGKRELAQLNPFDLVVLLTLSNTVQNAIIGEDNSLAGGVVGAFSLLGINWMVNRILFRFPRLNHMVEGEETVLILHGNLDLKAMKKERLTEKELLSAIHKQGFDGFEAVEKCVLEPAGTFFVVGKKPNEEEKLVAGLQQSIQSLREEIEDLRRDLKRA